MDMDHYFNATPEQRAAIDQTNPTYWINSTEACKRLGITDKTLRRYIATGKLRAYRMGERARRFKAEDLDALMKPIPADPAPAKNSESNA